MTAEWKRIHRLPQRWYRGAALFTTTPRQNYLYEQSKARYDRRPDAIDGGGLITGEIGRYEGVRFIKPISAPNTEIFTLHLPSQYVRKPEQEKP